MNSRGFTRVLTLIIISLLVLAVLVAYFNKPEKSKILPPYTKPTTTVEKSITATGVLRYSGVSTEEKTSLGLNFSEFQLSTGKVPNYYLESDNKPLKSLLGKCVTVTGTVPDKWKDVKSNDYKMGNSYTYGGLALNLDNIRLESYLKCKPYPENPVRTVDGGKTKGSVTQALNPLKGSFKYAQRLAPDIGYDYTFDLDEPFADKFTSSGKPAFVTQTPAIPKDNLTWMILEDNIGEKLSVEGEMAWGYAESKYFDISKVNEPYHVSSDTAVALVINLPEVSDYLKRVPNGIVQLESHKLERGFWEGTINNGTFLVHVYKVKDNHTATFNWYEVSQKTGRVAKMFDFK